MVDANEFNTIKMVLDIHMKGIEHERTMGSNMDT